MEIKVDTKYFLGEEVWFNYEGKVASGKVIDIKVLTYAVLDRQRIGYMVQMRQDPMTVTDLSFDERELFRRAEDVRSTQDIVSGILSTAEVGDKFITEGNKTATYVCDDNEGYRIHMSVQSLGMVQYDMQGNAINYPEDEFKIIRPKV